MTRFSFSKGVTFLPNLPDPKQTPPPRRRQRLRGLQTFAQLRRRLHRTQRLDAMAFGAAMGVSDTWVP